LYIPNQDKATLLLQKQPKSLVVYFYNSLYLNIRLDYIRWKALFYCFINYSKFPQISKKEELMKTSFKKIILFLLCALSLSGAVTAQGKTYLIGVEDLEYLPNYTSKNDKYTGFAREILDTFARKQGYVFKYRILPIKRLLYDFLEQKVDFKFPDNPNWKRENKKGVPVFYTNSVIEYIDGVMVLPLNKGKSIKSIKTLGTVLGFTAWDYLDLIKAKKITLFENSSFTGLIMQALSGRIDGVYINPVVCNYQLEKVFKKKNGLVFDPGLPHTRSSYMLSSIKHPKIIETFNRFLVENKQMIEMLKNRYKVKVKINSLLVH
jgi:ABC-type amino acid transport substrate-binding protein